MESSLEDTAPPASGLRRRASISRGLAGILALGVAPRFQFIALPTVKSGQCCAGRLVRRLYPGGVVLLAITAFGSSPSRAEPVTAEQQVLISAALPTEAPALPAEPRRLLVYTQTKSYRHASIECGVEALTLMGERTGAYRVTVADQPDVFTPESLRRYDAVLFLSSTGEIFDTEESRRALLDYVRGGGGIVGIHAATDCCQNWPEWGQMMGGYFDQHPWSSKSHVTLWIEEPDHPLNAAFDGRISFPIQDEIYQLRDPYSRETHRVIISLDTRRTDTTSPGIAARIKRTDGDFAISQLRNYDKGRVFYCALGHRHEIFWNPVVLGHYLAGIQWAMGDLEADAMPQPRPERPPPATDP